MSTDMQSPSTSTDAPPASLVVGLSIAGCVTILTASGVIIATIVCIVVVRRQKQLSQEQPVYDYVDYVGPPALPTNGPSVDNVAYGVHLQPSAISNTVPQDYEGPKDQVVLKENEAYIPTDIITVLL